MENTGLEYLYIITQHPVWCLTVHDIHRMLLLCLVCNCCSCHPNRIASPLISSPLQSMLFLVFSFFFPLVFQVSSTWQSLFGSCLKVWAMNLLLLCHTLTLISATITSRCTNSENIYIQEICGWYNTVFMLCRHFTKIPPHTHTHSRRKPDQKLSLISCSVVAKWNRVPSRNIRRTPEIRDTF